MEVTTSAEALRRQRAALGGSATTRAAMRLNAICATAHMAFAPLPPNTLRSGRGSSRRGMDYALARASRASSSTAPSGTEARSARLQRAIRSCRNCGCARRAPRVPEPRCCGCAIGCSNSASTWSAPSAASSCTCRARRRISTRGARSPFPSGRAPGNASNASLDPRARPPSRRSCPWPALHDAHRAAYCCSTTPSPVDGVIQDACADRFASRSHPAGGRSGPLMNDPR